MNAPKNMQETRAGTALMVASPSAAFNAFTSTSARDDMRVGWEEKRV